MSLQMISENFTIVGGAAMVVCVMLLLYLIYTYSIKEKSFEEVMEEQRKQTLQEEQLSKQEKTKKDKEKKHKKWGKKKEKSDQLSDHSKDPDLVIQSETQAIPEPIEEIEIIEPKEIAPKKKSKGKQQQASPPIVAIVAEPQKQMAESANPPQKTAKKEKVLAEIVPKKVVESAPKKAVEVAPKKVVEELSPVPKVVDNKATVEPLKQKQATIEAEKTVVSETVVQPSAIQSAAPSKKKKKADQSDKVDIAHMTVNQLISIIKDTAFDDEENQMVIDALLNKQKEESSWKKNDSRASLKKHLAEKDIALEHEQKQNQAITQRLRQELLQEKTKAVTLEKALQEKTSVHKSEIEAITHRMKQTQEKLTVEKVAAEEKAIKLQNSLESKTDMIKKLESETKAGGKPTELETMKKSREELQKVHNLLVEQHTQHISNHKEETKILNTQLADMKKSLQKAHDTNLQLTKDVESLNQKCQSLERGKTNDVQLKAAENASKSELKRLQGALEESKLKYKDLETQIQKLAKKADDFEKQNAEFSSEIEKLHSENERLSAELATTNERVAGDGQEMTQQNGDIKGKIKDEEKLCEQTAILQEKESVLTQLYDDLNLYKTKLSNLNEEIELHKQKNNELREKNWKAMDALAAAEKQAEQKIQEAEKKAEETLKQLRIEMEERLKSANENSSSSNASSLELSDQLSQTQKSLKELQLESSSRLQELQSQIEKNSQVSADLKQIQEVKDALEDRLKNSIETEKALVCKLDKFEDSSKSCFHRIFPSVSIENTLPHDEWLSKFEKQALDVIQAISCTRETELLARLSKAEEEKQSLIAKISHYEAVVAGTETTLISLQDSAKKQQALWEEKLSNKETELQKVSKELELLLAEKESLNSTIQQMGRLDELQDKLMLLQTTLQDSQCEKNQIELKFTETDKKYADLRDQVDSKDKTIQELQKEVASFDHLKKELDDVKLKLEKEKKISKDFSTQMVRLNSLVKIGQDALQAEQENVKKLQSQLTEAKVEVTTSNGTNSSTNAEESESQAKTLQTEKPKKTKRSDGAGKK